MKLSLYLAPDAEHKLKKLLQAKDGQLLSTLHELGITELRGEAETISITPVSHEKGVWARVAKRLGLKSKSGKPSFTISVTRTAMSFRTEVSLKETPENTLTPEGEQTVSPLQKALELLGMMVESQNQFNTAIQRRFILALEQAVASEDMEAVEALASMLHMAEGFFLRPRLRRIVAATSDVAQGLSSPGEVEELMASSQSDVMKDSYSHSLKKKLNDAKISKSHTRLITEFRQSLTSPTSGLRILIESISMMPMAQGELRQALSSLDSMWSPSLETRDSGSSENALVIVRETVKQLAELTEQSVPTVRHALGQLAAAALVPLPELRWHLQKKAFGFGSRGADELLPERFDLAWELLAGFALMAVAHRTVTPFSEAETPGQRDTGIEESNAPILNVDTGILRYATQTLSTVKAVVLEISRKINARTIRQRETLAQNLQALVESEFRFKEPLLVLQVSARLAASGGNLLWRDCLALANARARHHRFLDPDDAVSRVEVAHDVETHAGGMTFHFSIVPKRVPLRIREAYEQLPLAGRIQVMSELVEYAKRHHTAAIQISSAQIAQQVEMDDDELLRAIRKKTT